MSFKSKHLHHLTGNNILFLLLKIILLTTTAVDTFLNLFLILNDKINNN